jgi:hypothetical protein
MLTISTSGPSSVRANTGFILTPNKIRAPIRTDIDQIKTSLYSYNPFIKIIEDQGLGNKMVIAGGAVVDALSGYEDTVFHTRDIDIFLHSMTIAEADTCVKQFCRDYCDKAETYFTGAKYPIHITFNKAASTISITFKCKDQITFRPVQIIYRVFDSVEAIINNIDVQCCKCAFDGNRVVSTADGSDALMSGFNTITLKNWRHTYEERLSKYLSRGYGILFPNMMQPKVSRVQLPRMIIHLDGHYITSTIEDSRDHYRDGIELNIASGVSAGSLADRIVVQVPIAEWSAALTAVENRSMIKPLKRFTGKFNNADHTDIVGYLRLSKKEIIALETQAVLTGIPYIDVLQPLIDAHLELITNAYTKCLQRVTVYNNTIWDVVLIEPASKWTEAEWYGSYYCPSTIVSTNIPTNTPTIESTTSTIESTTSTVEQAAASISAD